MPRVEDVIFRLCELEEFRKAEDSKNWTPGTNVEENMKVVYEWDPHMNGYKEVCNGGSKPSLAQSKTMDRVLGWARVPSRRQLTNLPMTPGPRFTFLL